MATYHNQEDSQQRQREPIFLSYPISFSHSNYPIAFSHSNYHPSTAIPAVRPQFAEGSVASLLQVDLLQTAQDLWNSSNPFDQIGLEPPQQLLHKSVTQAQRQCYFFPLPAPSLEVGALSHHQGDLVLSSPVYESPNQGLNTATAQVVHALSYLYPPTPQDPSPAAPPCVPRLNHSHFRSPPNTPPPSSPPSKPMSRSELRAAVSVSGSPSQPPPPPPKPPNSSQPSIPSSNRRRRLTMDETEYLMAQFCKNEKPNTKERLVFAEHLGLHPRTIQVWFQNRRAKLKRDDSLARALYPQLHEAMGIDSDTATIEQKQARHDSQSRDSKDKDVDVERNHDQRKTNSAPWYSQAGTRIFDERHEGSGDDGLQGVSRTRQPLAATTKELPRGGDDVSHRGSGTETFIGCERSETELECLFGSETEQYTLNLWEKLDFTRCFPSNSSRINVSGTNTCGAGSHGTRGTGTNEGLEYYDMAGLDSGLDLMYEFVFGSPSEILTRRETCHSARRLSVNNEDEIQPSFEPYLSESGDPRSSAVSIEKRVSKDKDVGRAPEFKGRQLPAKPFSRVSGSKADKHPYTIPSSNQAGGSRPKTVGVRHPSSLLLRHHNPIPPHQMALTLLPTADSSSTTSPGPPR